MQQMTNLLYIPLFFFQKQVRNAILDVNHLHLLGLQQTTVGYTFLQSLSQMPFAVVFLEVSIANSVDPVQIASDGAVWSGSTLFTCKLKLISS